MKPISWRNLYSKEDVELCMSKIKLVGFNERISVFGSLVVQPKSAGNLTFKTLFDQIKIVIARRKLEILFFDIYDVFLISNVKM